MILASISAKLSTMIHGQSAQVTQGTDLAMAFASDVRLKEFQRQEAVGDRERDRANPASPWRAWKLNQCLLRHGSMSLAPTSRSGRRCLESNTWTLLILSMC